MAICEDNQFMREALKEAGKAARVGEAPVGAVLVLAGKIIGRGYNQSIRSNDPTAHAEIVTIRQAAKKLKNYRLSQTTLYVTVEPCLMCLGALLWARVTKIVYGVEEPKTGALHLPALFKKFPHKIEVIGGVEKEECRALLQNFFKEKRK
ncbi:MAG: tRNA adenosine(34) deaminase TadA [Elusimicrobiota bacterium]